ncbi:hypothetical protein LWI28_026332 [Acer negundo]|uniref:Uncharacterized protein n=1 Tax=Acer negundo TaxID=4023 RepID=A0AAD5J706_ACENE|nr:hypothetical protein LWI28_026332 [Acer negundo]
MLRPVETIYGKRRLGPCRAPIFLNVQCPAQYDTITCQHNTNRLAGHILTGLVLGCAAYFWPLFLSTALFLVAVVFFGKTSPPAAAAGDKAGEGLLDYVAGQPPEEVGHVESFKPE